MTLGDFDVIPFIMIAMGLVFAFFRFHDDAGDDE
jgi:hypothetical protein